MSNWDFLNKHRISRDFNRGEPEIYWSTPELGWNGMFRFFINDQQVRCICSDGCGWKHVSVSLVGDRRTPRWEVMCAIKDLFFEEEDAVIQFHPPKSVYVNHHPGCLHLWMPTDHKIKTPNPELIGPK